MASYISTEVRQAVATLFGRRCAYCMTPAWLIGDSLTIDHIIPQSLGGESVLENLCLDYGQCNLLKNDRITGVDPSSGLTVRLYHPHHLHWREHFTWAEQGIIVQGVTPIGRGTVATLRLNREPLLESRRYWIQAGWHPPDPRKE